MKYFIKTEVTVFLLLSMTTNFAVGIPQWWEDRGIIDTNSLPNDFAPANQGQAKYIAYQAYLEFKESLGFVGSNMTAMVEEFSVSENYLPLNLGQLKYLSTPFYDQLNLLNMAGAWPSGMVTGPYPWSGSINNLENYAIANIGQLKYLFSFDLSNVLALDSDGDGMSDDWEITNGFDPNNSHDAILDEDLDGVSNLQEYHNRTDPHNDDVISPTVIVSFPSSLFLFVP
jgi:hypothetical protein